MKVHFRDIKEGEKFSTRYSKRLMTCVKVGLTTVSGGEKRNAVILLDHTESPAHDLGTLVSFKDGEYVEVSR